MMIDPEHRKRLRLKTLEHLEAAHALMDEAEDGMAVYLIGSAMDEIRSQELGAPRDDKVIPLVPRK